MMGQTCDDAECERCQDDHDYRTCDVTDCERCQDEIDFGFAMACDKCDAVGSKNSDAWRELRGRTLCLPCWAEENTGRKPLDFRGIEWICPEGHLNVYTTSFHRISAVRRACIVAEMARRGEWCEECGAKQSPEHVAGWSVRIASARPGCSTEVKRLEVIDDNESH